MSKKYISFIAIAFAVAVSGCSQKNKVEDEKPTVTQAVTQQPTITPTSEPTVTPEPTVTSEPTATPEPVAKDYQVEIKEHVVSDSQKSEYPVISDWILEDKQKEWNDKFLKQAIAATNGMTENDEFSNQYVITTQTPEILSMQELGYDYYDGAAHPNNYNNTLTIDMTTGEQLWLKDYADTYEIASTLLSGKGYTMIGCEEVTMQDIWDYDFYGEAPKEEELAEVLSHFDGPTDEYGDSTCFGSSYIKDGKVILVLMVPHVYGDYIDIQID